MGRDTRGPASASSARRWADGYGRVLAGRLLLNSYFFVPYIALYARQLHIALGLLLVIESVFALLTVCFDLPAGHLADRIGPRQALLLGTALEGTAALLLGLLPHMIVFWSVQPLFAASQALTMGADAALAAAVLRRAGQLDRFEEGERLFQSAVLAVTAVVLLTSSGLSLVGLRYTFVATAVAQFAAVIVLLTVTRRTSAEAEDVPRIPMAVRARGLAAGIRGAPALRKDLLGIILMGTAFSALLYLMPLYFVAAGSDEHLVGLLAAAVSMAAAAGSRAVPRRFPLRLFIGLAVIAAGFLSLELLAVTLIAAVTISTAQARVLPRARSRVLADLHAHGDATAMSIVTTSRNVGFALLAPFLGGLAALIGINGLGIACAALFLLGGLALTREMSTDKLAKVQVIGTMSPEVEKS
jgi:MFS family permease